MSRECAGTTKKGKKCTNKGTIIRGKLCFCKDHLKQSEELEVPDDADDVLDAGDDDLSDEESNERVVVAALHEVCPPQPRGLLLRLMWCADHNCRVCAYTRDPTWCCAAHAAPTVAIQDEIEVIQELEVMQEEPVASSAEVQPGTVCDDATDTLQAAVEPSLDDGMAEGVVVEELAAGISDFDDLVFEEDYVDEGNDNLLRLQEQTEVGGLSDEEEVEDQDVEMADYDEAVTTEYLEPLRAVKVWKWQDSPEERRKHVISFLHSLSNLTNKLSKSVDPYITEARVERAQAGSESFKASRVVFATVVGCSRRLDAIRAADPFAVIVEEACEVQEAVLMSVLAVKSLKKLELIGDHRQLPAFIQQVWYSFEFTTPSIKASLFERLVSGTVSAYQQRKGKGQQQAKPLACTILDIQYRMRTSLADITKPFYRDIVDIKDHDRTKTQRIGDRLPPMDKAAVKLLKLHRDSWAHGGRHVPGLKCNIYFWDIPDNKESRPIAGLSACNSTEATYVVELTKYLLLCGVPSTSITIITPYKGQKTLITKELVRAKCLGYRDGNPSLIVSTVDRYQGDENDIVILSLVRAKSGNKFIALKNRFIVALSRARLGLMIIGSRGAVDGPDHWKQFIKQVADSKNIGYESNEEGDAASVDDHADISSKLPICCPRHDRVALCIDSPKDFPSTVAWGQFCREPCTSLLSRCGHECQLPCHCPTVSHNNTCKVRLRRHCTYEEHFEEPLLCSAVAIKPGQSLQSALVQHPCEIMVRYQRQGCSHVLDIECHVKKELDAELCQLEACAVTVEDYIHPVCGHKIKSPKCGDRQRWEHAAPSCKQAVSYQRPCGCVVRMKCFEAMQERIQPKNCENDVNIHRPRCGHEISLRCYLGTALCQWWEQQQGESAYDGRKLIVIAGGSYGPPESNYLKEVPVCLVESSYIAACGHEMKSSCNTCFLYSSGALEAPKCKQMVEFPCPLCNEAVTSFCWVRDYFSKNWKVFTNVNEGPYKNSQGKPCLHEAHISTALFPELPNDIAKILPTLCLAKVQVFRTCNGQHYTELKCSELGKLMRKGAALPKCSIVIDRPLDCSHSVRVKCCDRDAPPPECTHPIDTFFQYPCGIHQVAPGTCSRYRKLVDTVNINCPEIVTTDRRRCRHAITLPCYRSHLAKSFTAGICSTDNTVVFDGDYCEPELDLPDCAETVTYVDKCGHSCAVRCCDAFLWANNNDITPPCATSNVIANPICGHELVIPCSQATKLAGWVPFNEKVVLHQVLHGFDENNEEIITEYIDEHDVSNLIAPLPAGITRDTMSCNIPITLNRSCQHSCSMLCSDVFHKRFGDCKELVPTPCDSCGTSRAILCVEVKSGVHKACQALRPKRCSICDINSVEIECYKTAVSCNKTVSFPLQCGHEYNWECGSGVDPRKDEVQCRACILPRWQRSASYDPSPEEVADIRSCYKNFVAGFLESIATELECKTTFLDIPESEIRDHLGARRLILNKFCDFIQDSSTNERMPDAPALPGSGDFASSYELVFTRGNKKDIFPVNQPTEYGFGMELRQLTLDTMRKVLKAGKNLQDGGHLDISILVAFRNKTLVDTPIFAIRNKKGSTEKANKTSKKYKDEGFDSVAFRHEEEFEKRVYWTPKSVMKIATALVRYRHKCNICWDMFDGENNGFKCVNEHFTCWSCLRDRVKDCGLPGAVGKTTDPEGNMMCAQCEHAITTHEVAKIENYPKDVFQALENLKVTLLTDKRVAEALATQKLELEAEFRRIQAIQDREERDIELLKYEIINEILNLQCPKCKMVFVDYTGCNALSCGNRNCNASFCAWCLGSYPDSHATHQHVLVCNENKNPGSYFSTEGQFLAHHKERKRKLIIARLKGRERRIVEGVLAKINAELRTQGIPVVSLDEVLDRVVAVQRQAPVPMIQQYLGNILGFNIQDYDLEDSDDDE